MEYLLASRPTAKLVPCPEKNKTIIRDVSMGTIITFVSFSPAIKIEITTTNDGVYDSDVHDSVVRACHKVTKPCATGIVKYEFITICAKDADIVTPNSIPSCHQHILPNELLCEDCKKAKRIDGQLDAWNNALKVY